MNKKEFEQYFKTHVMPGVAASYERDGIPDKPARREAWNVTIDSMIRDGQLSSRAGDWKHPDWLETVYVEPGRTTNPPLGLSWAKWGIAALFVGVGVLGFTMGRIEARKLRITSVPAYPGS